jgi:hypothetical protein
LVLSLEKEAWYVSHPSSPFTSSFPLFKFGIVEKCFVPEREDKTQQSAQTISLHLSIKLGERQAGERGQARSREERTLPPDTKLPFVTALTGHGGQAAIGGAQVRWTRMEYQAHVREHGSRQSLFPSS